MSSDEASSIGRDSGLREQLDLVDQVCDRFEAAWRVGDDPSIDEYLAQHANLPRHLLLRELLFLELSYRAHQQGVLPRVDEYLTRFEQDVSLVLEVFSELERTLPRTRAEGAIEHALKHSRFHVVRFLDEGGLGRVWIATDEELKRQVALKDLKDCFADVPQLRTRFVAEAEITARLEHPGIVPVYGFGQYEDGRPYYAMRFIHGRSLAHEIKQLYARSEGHRVMTEDRIAFAQLLRRFLDVCHAIEFAHSQGIVHRDLKPSNIMLGEFGETLVVDWGLAKQEGLSVATDGTVGTGQEEHAVQRPGADDVTWTYQAGVTQPGTAIGTPQYMSPEQADGRVQDVGKASDIYGLGATLYCLLTGQAPFTPTGRSDIPAQDTIGQLLERVKKGDKPHPQQVNPGVPKALAAICEKAMAVEPMDRYAEVRLMREDVERWLANEPVVAYREPLLERIGRWSRRHRTGVQAAMVVLLITSIVSVVAAWRLNIQKNITEEARSKAESLATRNRALALAEHDARRLAERQLAQAQRNAYAAQLSRATTLALGDDPAGAYDLLADQEVCPLELRDFTWRHLHRWCRQDLFRTWRAHAQGILCAQTDGHGEMAYSLATDGTLRVWDLMSHKLLREYHTSASLSAAAMSDDLVVALGLETGSVCLWQMGTLDPRQDEEVPDPVPLPVPPLAGDARVRGVAFSGDGGTVAAILQLAGEELPHVAVWDVGSRSLLADWPASLPVNRLAVSPRGERIALGGWTVGAEQQQLPATVVWDRETKSQRWEFPACVAPEQREEFLGRWGGGAVSAACYSDNGSLLLIGTTYGALVLLDAETGSPLAPFAPAHNGTIRAVSAGTRQFVTAGPASSIRGGVYRPDLPVTLWRLEAAMRMYELAGLVGDVATMQFTSDESYLTIVTRGGGLAVFDARPEWTRSLLQASLEDERSGYSPVVHVCFGDQGHTLTAVVGHSLYEDRVERLERVERWNLAQGTRDVSQSLDKSSELFVAQDGTFVASAVAPGAAESVSLVVKDLVTQSEIGRLRLADDADVAAVSLTAKRAVVLHSGRRFEIVDLVGGQALCEWDVAKSSEGSAALSQGLPLCRFSPSGDRLAMVLGAVSELVELRDTLTGRPVATRTLADPAASCLAFSPDGDQLAIATRVREVPGTRTSTIRFLPPRLTLWNIMSDVVYVCPHGHGGDIYSMSYSPDGRTLATAAHDMTVRLWETASGLELLAMETVSQTDAMSVAFSPDGNTLAVASWNGWVELWHATAQPRWVRQDAELLVERLSDTPELTDAMLRQFQQDVTSGKTSDGAATDVELDAVAILEYLAWQQALATLALRRDDIAETRTRSRQVEQRATLVHAANPESQKALAALMAARYLSGRPESARQLLAASDVTDTIPEVQAMDALVRLKLGRLDEADRLCASFQQSVAATLDHASAYRAAQLRQLSEILQQHQTAAQDASAHEQENNQSPEDTPQP